MKLKKLLAPVLSLSLMLPVMASAAAAPPQAVVDTPAAQLRASLDYLLSEHFTLAVTAMTKAYDGSRDAAAAYQALDQNALDMQPAITSLYGEAGGTEFERIFRQHNKYTDDLVKAVKANDTAARQKAEQEVQGFVTEFAAFLSTATASKLPQTAAEEAIRSHENHVQQVLDAYVAGDYNKAYTTYRTGFQEMFTISKVLSTAIATQMPDKFQNTRPDTKAADLRSALNSVAAEHFALSVLEMQKQFDGKADYQALINAEAGNTADFKAAVASIYGAAGGDAFEQIWVGNHITAQSDYVNAVKNNDAAARAAVLARIDGFTMELGKFLGTATAGKLPASAAQTALKAHEGQVQSTLDQYAAGDYTASYTTNRAGYKTMFGVGLALSGAIVAQFNDKFQEAAVPAGMTTVWMKLNSKELNINGIVTMMDTRPSNMSGTTYIPLRYLGEGIGAKVKYDHQTRTVWVMAGSDTLKFWIDSNVMEVNGMQKSVGAKVIINKDGRTMVPLRFIAELLQWNVTWNQTEGLITLMKEM
ncbi:copper amine oxidase N-terminal domain-containing protein [Paenibacillus sp. P46E]|uniref:copper amine oxidase N-terminal domain-containing protein n=1 Tax=Paenibacillus sp. P46E TaxID=1349436 RepID=UPI00093A9FA6|nr:copper amine oxidase N-terminal domain-containing protein [Paenibacillus sp. P46E]OKP98761.1 copper amine oxidase [Paenibacillus sp. P46E]